MYKQYKHVSSYMYNCISFLIILEYKHMFQIKIKRYRQMRSGMWERKHFKDRIDPYSHVTSPSLESSPKTHRHIDALLDCVRRDVMDEFAVAVVLLERIPHPEDGPADGQELRAHGGPRRFSVTIVLHLVGLQEPRVTHFWDGREPPQNSACLKSYKLKAP